MTRVLGIDVGGSGIKGAVVDVDRGEMLTERRRIPTPQPSTPQAVASVAAEIAASFAWEGPVGCGLPAIVSGGIAGSAANIDPSWIGTDAAAVFGSALGGPVVVLNDADAAGVAEMRFGAGRGRDGVVLLLTFGSGIGSALFNDGLLVPNLELGHLEFHAMPAEHYAAARLVEHAGMALEVWAGRVREILVHLERVFTPALFMIGGGISKRFEEFSDRIGVATPIVAAAMRNNAGIVGAALAGAGGTAGGGR